MKRPGGETFLEQRGDLEAGAQWLWAAWTLTALGEIAASPGSISSLHLWDPCAPDTMSPWTVAPISVPTISKVIPGAQHATRWLSSWGWARATPSHPTARPPALTVRSGRVPLLGVWGQQHGQRRVGHLEELRDQAELRMVPTARWPTQVSSFPRPGPCQAGRSL